MKSQWLDILYQIIHDNPKKIVLFWITLSIICSFWSFQLTDYTVLQTQPPQNYPSSIALKQLDHYFPNKTIMNIEIIVLEKHSNDNNSIINQQTEQICNNLKEELSHFDLVKSFLSYYDYHQSNASNQAIDNLIKPKFVNENEDMMLIILILDNTEVSNYKVTNLLNHIHQSIQDISSQSYANGISLKMTGYQTMFQAFVETIKNDITGRDLIMGPFIFIYMIYVLGSWKLILLPLLCLVQSILISFAFLLPFAKYKVLNVVPFAPTTMLCIIMAISIDYSLFLLSKFSSSCRNGQNVEESVKNMINFSGHVCILSACILILCYVGLVFFNVYGIDTMGYGSSIAVIFCAAINITFSASVLLIFPDFFTSQSNRDWRYRIRNEVEETEMDDMDTPIDGVSECSEVSNSSHDYQHNIMECRDNIYFKMAQIITKSPYNIITSLLLYFAMIPVIIVGFMRHKVSIDDAMLFPSNADSAHLYQQLKDNFNPGILSPITVVAINHDRNDIWSLAYFQNLCDLGNILIKNYGYKPTDLMSVAFAPNSNNNNDDLICMGHNKLSLYAYKNAIETGKLPDWITTIYPSFTSEIFEKYYLSYFHQSVNNQASLLEIAPNFNPFIHSDSAKRLRSSIYEKASLYGDNIELHVNSPNYQVLDCRMYLYERIPIVLSIIVVVIFSFVGFMYGVYFLPFRLFLCIVVPILFVYGITSLIYEQQGIVWMTPSLTLTILIGLALDYELFLFSRIYDFRLNGFTTRASIILGVSLSGPIITSAGIIMSLAFLGLLLQPTAMARQIGTIYVLGVVIDTFIIRPFLVPSLLSLTFMSNSKDKDKWIWYPVQMPTTDLLNEYGQLDRS